MLVCRAPSKPMPVNQKCSYSSSDETSDSDDDDEDSDESSDDDNDISVSGVHLPPPTLHMNVQPANDSAAQVICGIVIVQLS